MKMYCSSWVKNNKIDTKKEISTTKKKYYLKKELLISTIKNHSIGKYIEIKNSDFQKTSHQCTLDSPTNITNELYDISCQLFDQLWDGSPIRLLGVSANRIVDESAPRQIQLFGGKDYEKMAKLDQAIDSIRGKYGVDSVKRAVFQKNKVEHIAGKLSKEKRSVDYDELDIE